MATIGQQLLSPETGWTRYQVESTAYMRLGGGTEIYDYTSSGGGLTARLSVVGSYVEFKFTGTSIRIIGTNYSAYDRDSKITIDGVTYSYSNGNNATYQFTCLLFEKTGLANIEHTVKIYRTTAYSNNNQMHVDAIDFNSGTTLSKLPIQVGDQLTGPEEGWKRYDDTHPAIKYTGAWSKNSTNDMISTTIGSKVNFQFLGAKLRILVYSWSNRSDMSISIDGGTPVTFKGNQGTSNTNTLAYEVTNLAPTMHSVEINHLGVNGTVATLDAIDIDSTGRLYHPDEIEDIKSLEIGKRIRCHYTASSNAFGTFSGLGQETSDFIPAASSATPNHDFYWIAVNKSFDDKWICVASHNVQHSISWDILNSQGIPNTGLPISIAGQPSNVNLTVRLLTGGISSTDAQAGNSEWDQYIVSSSLNGKIQPGDNNVWNWNAIGTWTSTTGSTAGNRVRRGASPVDGYANTSASSLVSAAAGFRPVLLVESLSTSKYLIEDNGEIKKLTPGAIEKWDTSKSSAGITLSNNNVTVQIPSSTYIAKATKGMVNGKWYWEYKIDTQSSGMYGIANINASTTSNSFTTTNVRYIYYNGKLYPGALTYSTTTIVTGDVLGFALDMDNGTLEIYLNGVSLGVAFTDIFSMGEVFPSVSSGSGTSGPTVTAIFNKNNFKYPIPAGYIPYESLPTWSSLGSAPATEALFQSDGMDDSMIHALDESAFSSLVSATPKLLCWTNGDTNKTASMTAIPYGQVIFPTEDISLPGNGVSGFEVIARNIGTYSSNVIPAMTGNSTTSNGITYMASASGYAGVAKEAFRAFEGNASNNWAVNAATGWLQIDLGSGNAKKIGKYVLKNYSSSSSASPKNWTFEGSNNASTWTILDTQSNKDATYWSANPVSGIVTYEYAINNNTAYRYYRINISAPVSGTTIGLDEMQMMEALSGNTNLRILASVDVGATWKSFDGSAWSSLDSADLTQVKTSGMTPATFNAITQDQWNTLLAGGNKIRFAYYLEQESSTDTVEVDSLSFSANPVATETPSLDSVKITFDELTVEGRLQDLERINAINLSKLNFKSNALLNTEKYALHDMIVDTFETATSVDTGSTTASYDGLNKEYTGTSLASSAAPDVVALPEEVLPSSRKKFMINTDATDTDFEYTLDGVTWNPVTPFTVVDVSAETGTNLKVRAKLKSPSARFRGIALSWM